MLIGQSRNIETCVLCRRSHQSSFSLYGLGDTDDAASSRYWTIFLSAPGVYIGELHAPISSVLPNSFCAKLKDHPVSIGLALKI